MTCCRARPAGKTPNRGKAHDSHTGDPDQPAADRPRPGGGIRPHRRRARSARRHPEGRARCHPRQRPAVAGHPGPVRRPGRELERDPGGRARIRQGRQLHRPCLRLPAPDAGHRAPVFAPRAVAALVRADGAQELVLGQCPESARRPNRGAQVRRLARVLRQEELLLGRAGLGNADRLRTRRRLGQAADRRRAHRAQRHHHQQRLAQHGPAPDRQRQRHLREGAGRGVGNAARSRPAEHALCLPAAADRAAHLHPHLPRHRRRLLRRGAAVHAQGSPALVPLAGQPYRRRPLRAASLRRILGRSGRRARARRARHRTARCRLAQGARADRRGARTARGGHRHRQGRSDPNRAGPVQPAVRGHRRPRHPRRPAAGPALAQPAHADPARPGGLQDQRAGRLGAEPGPADTHLLLVEDDMQLLTLPHSPALATSIRATASVFEDAKSQTLLAHLQKIAPSEASVLIIGETGTGKELVARHVHNLSNRRNGPFVAVNCGAFSESLVDAELFGHEKGAFTGALNAKAGWFEEANGGTLFLDEIGDLPMPIQVKLLRVLQEREVVRLGSRKSIPIDVRVLAATNVQLEKAINAGNFREDLYYRLNVVSLELQRLHERPGDILPLARHFIREYSRRLGYGEIHISPEAEQKLVGYAWPGNIRELENVIHHTLLICRDGVITANDLHLSSLRIDRDDDSRPASVHESADALLQRAFQRLFEEQGGNLHARVEDALMKAAYRFCHHNQVHTAGLLGLSRNITRAHLIRIGELIVNRRRGGQDDGRDRRLAQFSI
ncbi:UNVERIFIED_CONTAM: flbD [Trichonephila clavipes]